MTPSHSAILGPFPTKIRSNVLWRYTSTSNLIWRVDNTRLVLKLLTSALRYKINVLSRKMSSLNYLLLDSGNTTCLGILPIGADFY